MNYKFKTITGTHAATHDNYKKDVNLHKVEAFVNGKLWKKSDDLESELMVLNESENLIRETNLHITLLSNKVTIKPFIEQITELFS